ncbi:hypothetical protein FQN57_003802 [Myotisia sp. PD_48]|nr:hypothetical protein FQN57_003802 [Myotisia sp. PD_48]
MGNTTIVIVPGAWLSKSFYSSYITALENAGYQTSYLGYPSLDPVEPAKADCATDTAAIKEALKSLVEDEEKNVVLVCHSYGGMPGSAAATGLSKTKRIQDGKQGGVLGLIYVGAFLVPEGVSCAGAMGGSLPDWVLLDNPHPGLNIPNNPIHHFAADFDAATAAEMTTQLRPHSTLAFNSAQPAPAWADPSFKGRLAYIVTGEDVAVPKVAQYGMMAGTGQEWIVKEAEASHCATYKVKIDENLKQLEELVRAFEVV